MGSRTEVEATSSDEELEISKICEPDFNGLEYYERMVKAFRVARSRQAMACRSSFRIARSRHLRDAEAIQPNRGTLEKGMEWGSTNLKLFTLKLSAFENGSFKIFHFETSSF